MSPEEAEVFDLICREPFCERPGLSEAFAVCLHSFPLTEYSLETGAYQTASLRIGAVARPLQDLEGRSHG